MALSRQEMAFLCEEVEVLGLLLELDFCHGLVTRSAHRSHHSLSVSTSWTSSIFAAPQSLFWPHPNLYSLLARCSSLGPIPHEISFLHFHLIPFVKVVLEPNALPIVLSSTHKDICQAINFKNWEDSRFGIFLTSVIHFIESSLTYNEYNHVL